VLLLNGPVVARDDVAALLGENVIIYPLANDYDENGDPLRIISVTQPQHGTADFFTTSIVYHRGGSFFGSDQFTYTVTDDRGLTATAKVEVRPANLSSRKLLSVGDVLPSPSGDLTVKGFGTAGSGLGGMVRVQTESAGLKSWTLVNASDLSVMLRAGDPVPDLPGGKITSIGEPAGRAVLVKYTVNGSPFTPRQALLFMDSQSGPRLVAREGGRSADLTTLTSIDRFSEANGHVFLLGEMRQSDGRTAQTLRVWHDGQENELLRSGTSKVEETLVKSINTLVPVAGSPADNRWIDDTGRIAARVTLKNGSQAVGVWQAGQEPGIWEITGSMGPFGDKVLRLGPPAVCPDGIAYLALESVSRNFRDWTIYASDSEGFLDSFASTGGYATEEPETYFTRIEDPVAGLASTFAFMAGYNDLSDTWKGLFWIRGSDHQLIVREGDLLPGSNVERFDRIKSIVLSRRSIRGPIFTALSAKTLSLWATNEAGGPVLLMKPGKPLTIDGIERTVASFRALEAAKGPGIATRGVDESGRVEAIITFTDGTKSLVQFALP
jgi:hypothetical protein